MALVLLAYGVSGFVFGYLHFFMPGGFALLSGVPALAVSVGSMALAAGWGSHVVQRHWSTANAKRCKRVRTLSYRLCGALWGAALLAIVVGPASRPVALAPDADWFLAPLPWVWRLFLGFAADRMVGKLLAVGVVSLMLAFLFIKTSGVRIAIVCIGIVLCCLGAYFLGDAAYQYASGRGLLKNALGVAELAGDRARNPGSFNAWTFVCWWGGWTAVAFGSLAIAGGFFIPARLLRQGVSR